MIKFATILFSSLIFTTCSVSPKETPGLCTLTCGSASIAASDPSYKIAAKSSDMNFLCSSSSAGQALNPTLIYFAVSKDIQAEDQSTDGDVADGSNETGEGTYSQPVPYASIEPVINGIMSDEDSDNPNSPVVDGARVPIRYKGVATPSSDWCSDSCGVVGLEVAFSCPPAGETSINTVAVHSGALFSETINVTVTTEDAD